MDSQQWILGVIVGGLLMGTACGGQGAAGPPERQGDERPTRSPESRSPQDANGTSATGPQQTDEPAAATGAEQTEGPTHEASLPRSSDLPAEMANAMMDPDVDWDALEIIYSPMYSAYDGVHVFSLPAYVPGLATEPEHWQAVPADAVSFGQWQADDGTELGVLITVERPVQEVLITVSSGQLGGQATLYITEATPEQWERGKQRYVSGDSFDLVSLLADATPETLVNITLLIDSIERDADGNIVSVDLMESEAYGLSSNMRCDTCHTSGAENFQVQHTPTQIARFADGEIATILTEGKKPEGIGYRVLPPEAEFFYPLLHTWSVAEEQANDLVIYLRSLTPEGQGDVMLPFGLLASPAVKMLLPDACKQGSSTFDLDACMRALPPECNLELDASANEAACLAALMGS
ncbi:MAG: hypothetical protein OXU20_02030 [Myxococcales bacterium]|nr:hypothetical protein [Myxococcales bacterium]